MKTNIIAKLFIWCLLALCNINAYSAITVTLTKENSNVPDNVCNSSSYKYIATISGVTGSYTLTFNLTNGTIESTTISGTSTTATIKWSASSGTDGYKGQVKADLLVGTTHYLSDPISVTIKSIKHLTATFTGIPTGSPWNLSACESGTLSLEAGNMDVPGTGTIPERVNSFAWLVPKGWTVNGWTSPDGATWKITSSNVTVTYPKSDIGGSIKVKASYLTACGDVQESKESAVFTVNRAVAFTVTSNISYILCGDVSPVTYTVSPALPCALYYWNNSQTPTTNNSFQLTPNGYSPVIATVTIVYGTSTQSKVHTMNYQLFAPGVVPTIVGSAVICTANYQYSVSDLRPGYTVSWALDPKILRVSELDNVITVKSTSSGNATINATISSNCGTYSSIPTKTVWIGRPGFPSSVNGPSELTPGFSAVYSISPATGASSYSWQIPSGCYYNYCWHITSGQGTPTISVQAGAIGSGAIQCSATNTCGTDSRYMYINVQDPNAPCDPTILSISPNPSVGGNVVIDVIKPPCDPTLLSSEPATLSVIDNMGTVVYSKKHTGNKVEISGLNLIKGVYHVVYTRKNKKIEKSMIVQ